MPMDFHSQKSIAHTWGRIVGYGVAYLLFIAVLSLVLKVLRQVPEGWPFYTVLACSVPPLLLGMFLRRYLQ